MKQIKLLIILLVLQINTKAQTYIPFPNTTAVWTIFHYGQTGTDIFKYGMFGDTTFNGFSYKKIYQSTDYNFNLSNSLYRGAIREINKKIYRTYNGQNPESLLYDFTINVGDTAKITNGYGQQCSVKVDSIDYIMIYGQSHKRWKFNEGSFHYNEYWIEGIGSTFGLLLPLKNGSDNCYDLLCLSKDSTIIYHRNIINNTDCYSPISFDCDGVVNTTSISEDNLKNSKSTFFPNPFSSSAILKVNTGLENATITIYDILGQEVLKESHLNGEEIKINKGNLANGNYYYKISQKELIIAKGKFIIE
jgi:hypothetical protein